MFLRVFVGIYGWQLCRKLCMRACWTLGRARAMLALGVRRRRKKMSEKRSIETSAVSFSERLANSQVFASLFRDGMSLVEETATYLDGAGRQESKKLERSAALVYATESMRLTTRLMQLASWLLLHRAVKEGEMTLAQASKEKSKVRLASCDPGDAKSLAVLPAKLQELITRSTKLQIEVRRLDATMHAPTPIRVSAGNPVERQMGLLRAAFEQDSV
jgi:regulator of CtrA degradation